MRTRYIYIYISTSCIFNNWIDDMTIMEITVFLIFLVFDFVRMKNPIETHDYQNQFLPLKSKDLWKVIVKRLVDEMSIRDQSFEQHIDVFRRYVFGSDTSIEFPMHIYSSNIYIYIYIFFFLMYINTSSYSILLNYDDCTIHIPSIRFHFTFEI